MRPQPNSKTVTLITGVFAGLFTYAATKILIPESVLANILAEGGTEIVLQMICMVMAGSFIIGRNSAGGSK